MLTTREQEVLRLRSEGRTQTEVASLLSISQAAVSSFEKNAHRKIADAHATLKVAESLSSSTSPVLGKTPNERRG
ncbi:MAG: sigma factor-like helix-turn-helix DNA-binding protein [Candidatus Woesearchaeota archaeon]